MINLSDVNNSYPSHTGQTDMKPTTIDKNHQIRGEIGLQSGLIWFCRFGVGLCSGRQIFWERSFKHIWKISPPDKLSVVCQWYVCVVSVLSGSVRGRVCLNSATDGRWLVGLRSVMYRAYVGRPDTDSRPIQDWIKSDITPNFMELADTFRNQNLQIWNTNQM